ncbi:MAG: DUF6448 family protein [Byssovorax cruenta]
MFVKNRSKRTYLIILALVFAGVIAALASPIPAKAHCDSEQGPVATAARKALNTNNVNLILPYVKPEAEQELVAVFKTVVEVRKGGAQAQKLADQYFVETAVRLHRAGEGAPYAGLTDESTPEAILVADQALASGSVDKTYTYLDKILKEGIQKKYDVVVKARQEAKRLGTVDANRERVEAELAFEKYIYEIWGFASGEQLEEGGAH